MNIISCAGYFSTGSSAVTDFFSEFDNIKSLGQTEFKFLQDCDGVSSLEMHLIEHPHRHNTGHAIKRFINASKFENGNLFSKRYRKVWGNKYMEYTLEYISEITELQAECNWRGDAIEKGEFFYMINALVSELTMKLGKKFGISLMSLMHTKNYFTSISRTAFYEATKRYTSKLFNEVSDGKDFLMVDQLTPPSEVSRYMNYVDNMKVFIVDRDPRDVFLTCYSVLPHMNAVPMKASAFCDWYKILREHRKTDEPCDKALLVHFEDMVYHYDETTDKLMNFLALNKDNHKYPFAKFNPSISKKNTRQWEKYPEKGKDILYIEKNLKDFLYTY